RALAEIAVTWAHTRPGGVRNRRRCGDITRMADTADSSQRSGGVADVAGDGVRWFLSSAASGTIPVSCRLCRRPPALCGQPPLGVHSAKIQENSISVFCLQAGEGPDRYFWANRIFQNFR